VVVVRIDLQSPSRYVNMYSQTRIPIEEGSMKKVSI